MAICANAVQTSEGLVLVLDPMQTNPATCPYVVETGAESVIGSLGSLSVPDAQILGWAVCALWAVAWGIKQVARVLLTPEGEKDV